MPRFPGVVSIETEYEERIHMIAIRMIIEIGNEYKNTAEQD